MSSVVGVVRRNAPACLAVLVVALVLGGGSVAMATDPPAPTVQDFGVDFDEIINALITRMTEYVVPLILLALGLLAVGVFIGWMRSSARAH